jgi:hypothetical protein
MELIHILIFISGIFTSVILSKITSIIRQSFLMIEHKKIFTDVLEQIDTNKSTFTNRINQHITLDMRLKKFGKVTLFYDIDERILAISKENNVILLSNQLCEVFPDLIDNICDHIEVRWHKEIDDVVDVNGTLVSREFLENNLRKNLEEKGIQGFSIFVSPETPFNEISPTKLDMEEVQNTIDNILDKIGQTGIESLTPEEKDFLKKYGK